MGAALSSFPLIHPILAFLTRPHPTSTHSQDARPAPHRRPCGSLGCQRLPPRPPTGDLRHQLCCCDQHQRRQLCCRVCHRYRLVCRPCRHRHHWQRVLPALPVPDRLPAHLRRAERHRRRPHHPGRTGHRQLERLAHLPQCHRRHGRHHRRRHPHPQPCRRYRSS